MVTKTALGCILLSASTTLLGMCKKEEEKTTPTAEAAQVAPPPETTTVATATSSDVGDCPVAMVPQGGTVVLKQSFNVYKKPEPGAERLTGLAVGTLVDLKGSCGNWMKIMWPSAVATLSPGWIELKTLTDPRVSVTSTPAASAVPTTSASIPVPTASATASVAPTASATAPAASASGRPRIFKLPPIKKQ